MNTVWAQRREELLSDGIVSPDVFNQMVDRLGEFVVPSQQALETEAGQYPMHLSLQPASWTQIFIYGESRRIMQYIVVRSPRC